MPAAAFAWTEVARLGQIVPGTDPPLEIGYLRGGFSAYGEDSLVVLADGRVLLSFEDDDYQPAGLFRWSAEEGLQRLLARGAMLGDEDPLEVRRVAVLATHASGVAALEFSTPDSCADLHAVALLDLSEQASLAHRCADIAAALPGGADDGPSPLGIDEEGRVALRVSDPSFELSLLVPDEQGGFQVPLQTGTPAPGEPQSEVTGLAGSWDGDVLGVYARIDVMAPASPGSGSAVYAWDPAAGFTTITRLESGVDEFADIDQFQGDPEGVLTWLACCGGAVNGHAIVQSADGAPPVVLLAEGDAVPGGPPGAIVNGFWELVTGAPGRVAAQIEYYVGEEYSIGVVASDETGELTLRVTEGQAVPGRPGWTYGQGVPHAIGPDGTLAFSATLHDPQGSEAADQYAISRPDGSIVPLVADGDAFEVAPGDVRTVDYLDRLAVDSEVRHVAVDLSFDLPPGGQGIYFTRVPEPAAGWASAAMLAGLAARRRARGARR